MSPQSLKSTGRGDDHPVMFARRWIRFAFAIAMVALTSCGALPAATTTTDHANVEDSTSTTLAENTPATTLGEGAIDVTLRLPSDWSGAVVAGSSDDYPGAALQWEAGGSTLTVSLPGEGSYVFWAETPSSDDGLCFYQAQSDPQWRGIEVYDGQTVFLDLSGEVCE